VKRWLYLLALLPTLSFADPDCGSNDPESPCTGTSHTREVPNRRNAASPYVFEYSYTCSGGACQHGRFWDGSTWVRHPSGGNVVFSAVTPATAQSGWGKNIATGSNATSFTQGHFQGVGSDSVYSASLNLQNQLPYSAAPDNGVYIKTVAYSTTAGACNDDLGYDEGSTYCVGAYDAVVVVSDVPDDGANGRNTLRPNAAGSTKIFAEIAEFDFDILPRHSNFTAGNYTNIKNTWGPPFPHYYVGRNGNSGTRWVPAASNVEDYAAYRAGDDYMPNLFGVFDTDELTTAKRDAVLALVQYGIDIYGGYMEGVEWVQGAGQGMGHWLPMVLFGTLYDRDDTAGGEAIRDNIKAASNGVSLLGTGSNVRFTELHQVGPNQNGLPIWGGYPGSSTVSDGCNAGSYSGRGRHWANYADQQLQNTNSKRTCGDPYRWIDGPSEAPLTLYNLGRSSGIYVQIALVMKIWPEFREVANYDLMLIYGERMMNGGGAWTLPDQCTIHDPRESSSCDPFTTTTTASTCNYFGNTWGEDLVNNDGSCVSLTEAAARGHPSPGPRFPSRHLAGRPSATGGSGLGHAQPAYGLWDAVSPRTGNTTSATGTIVDDD
jgi:hypothetical protein